MRALFVLAVALAVLATAVMLATPFWWAAWAPGAAVILGMLMFARPEAGYWIMLTMIPLDILNTFNTSYSETRILSINKFLGIILIGLAGLKIATGQIPAERLRTRLWLAALALLGIYLLGTILSIEPAASLDQMRQYLAALLFMGLSLVFLGDRRGMDGALAAIVGSITIPALVSVAGRALSPDATERAIGLMEDPNFLSAIFLVAIPLVVWYLRLARSLAGRAWFSLLLFLNVAALILTYSRAAFLVLVVQTGLLAPDYLRHLRARHLGVALVALVLAGSVAAALVPRDYYERVHSLLTMSTKEASIVDLSLLRRRSYIPVALGNLAENPVLGSGPGTYPFIYSRTFYAPAYAVGRINFFRSAHDTWLEIASDMGLAGFLGYASLLVMAHLGLRAARRNFTEAGDEQHAYLAKAVNISLISLVLILTFISSPFHKYLWMLLGFSHALLAMSRSTAEGKA